MTGGAAAGPRAGPGGTGCERGGRGIQLCRGRGNGKPDSSAPVYGSGSGRFAPRSGTISFGSRVSPWPIAISCRRLPSYPACRATLIQRSTVELLPRYVRAAFHSVTMVPMPGEPAPTTSATDCAGWFDVFTAHFRRLRRIFAM